MEIVFLGTGGAETTPRVGCVCRVCKEARLKGGRFSRNGPALFLTGARILFDTSEDVGQSLERENVHQVDHLIYTHWHPDHTGGMRVLEQLNMDWLHRERSRVTDVWLPVWVRDDFKKMLGLYDHLAFMEKMHIARIREVGEGETFQAGGVKIRAYPMVQPGLTAFLLDTEGKRVVLAVDDTKDWNPNDELLRPDILVLESGWFDHDLKGRLIMPEKHPIREGEASFKETLSFIDRIQPRRTYLTHIENLWDRSYKDYLKLEQEYAKYKLHFAYDGLRAPISSA